MPIFRDNSVNHPDQGMTASDIAAVKRVAEQRNEIIMFRSTGCWSRPYIELGHPTKPFHVKGKSSDWGPQAGLVPEDSEFSKAFKQKDIEKGHKLNKEAIAGGFAFPTSLRITEQFLYKELLVPKSTEKRRAIDALQFHDTAPRRSKFDHTNPDFRGHGVYWFFCTKPADEIGQPGKSYKFLGFKTWDGKIEVHTLSDDGPSKPLMVMNVPGSPSDKPITGDYDLFAVCPSWSAYGSDDKKMDPTLDDPRTKASRARTMLKAARGARSATVGFPIPKANRLALNSLDMLDIIAMNTREDPDRGNVTPRILEVIRDLVAAMPNSRFPRVHHNAESGRPFAPGAEDGFPLTTFHPRRGIGGYNFTDATINDINDLHDYFNRLYADGYYPPRNRAWNMPSLHPLLPGYQSPGGQALSRSKLERHLLERHRYGRPVWMGPYPDKF